MIGGEMVADACFLLNLLATRREVRTIEALVLRLVATPQAWAEVQYLAGPRDERGRPTRLPVDKAALLAAGLRVVAVPEAAADLLVACAAELRRDGDSTSLALAAHLGLPLATDDRRVREVAGRQVPPVVVVSTLEVVREMGTVLSLSEAELAIVASDLAVHGNFLPPRDDALAAWYRELLARGR